MLDSTLAEDSFYTFVSSCIRLYSCEHSELFIAYQYTR